MKRFLSICAFVLFPVLMSGLGQSDKVLTQQMLDTAKETFVVNKNFRLFGQKLIVPEGLCLYFTGGSINDGELCGTNSRIEVRGKVPVFGLDLKISGTWDVPEVHDGWFAFDNSPNLSSNQLINNILAFSNDKSPCHIFFEEDRTYYFELPYKGRADIGEMVSFSMADGQKKRRYADIYDEDYSFLRIFTIPSHTHLTVNNTLKMLPTNVGAYFIFWEYGKEDVTVDGSGTIAGDNDWHIYDSPFTGRAYFGEWGHIFKCVRCKDFTFRDITLSDAFGDCVIYSGSSYPNEKNRRWASNLTMENVKILRARRNGVAVGARHVRISNCHFEGCGTEAIKGTRPQCAIDFEPDGVREYHEIGNQDAIMDDCTFLDNEYDFGSSFNNMPNYRKIATTVKNCHFTSPIKISYTFWIRFENCSIPALYRRPDREDYYSNYIQFENCAFGEDSASVRALFSKSGNTFTNCRYNMK